MPAPALPPELSPLGFLLGRWSGSGQGGFPTVDDFGYSEESVFWPTGRPFIGYRQRTWRDDGRPSHTESGFWRCPGEGRVELVVAHPNGIVEVSEGRVEGATITMMSTAMARTSTAKEVTALSRQIRVEAGVLSSVLEMAAVGVPLCFHLRARLERVAGGDEATGGGGM